MVYSDELEEAAELKYFGSLVNGNLVNVNGSQEREVITHFDCADNTFTKLGKVWENPAYSSKLKLQLINSNVLSLLMYGCKTWVLTKQLEKRIQSHENICLRRILGIHWSEL